MTSLTSLAISNGFLSGGLPTEIGLWGQKKGPLLLNLGINDLSGTIPSALSKATGLYALDLAANNFTGPIFDVGSLTNLHSLNLATNHLTGPLPSSQLLTLSNLQRLLLYENKLTGILPTEVGALSSLRQFEVDNNDLIGLLPTHLGQLTNLQRLLLQENEWMGTIPTQVGLVEQVGDVGARKRILQRLISVVCLCKRTGWFPW